MPDDPSHSPQSHRTFRNRCWHARWLLLIAFSASVCLVAATGALASYLLTYCPESAALPWAMMLPIGIIALAGSLYHLFRWRLPLRRMCNTLTLIRAGEAPINELTSVNGPLANLRASVQEILREIRQQKADMAFTQQEMRQRIARRTDALERLVGSLRQQASRDPLTGLYNRRALEEHLATVIEQTRAKHSDLCLLMLDLDNFKNLNDTLGHAAGDELLRTVGQIIRSSIREEDLAFRCGGDEFVVVLPDSGLGAGQTLVQRLVSLVDGLGHTFRTPRPLGLSAGLTVLSEIPDPHPQTILAEADKRLYAVKAARKAQDPPPPLEHTYPAYRIPGPELATASAR